MSTLQELITTDAQPGQVAWIGARPMRRAGLVSLDRVEIVDDGLAGDHGRAGKRAVTLFQAEHLDVLASVLGRQVHPEHLRRNIHVRGLNLSAFRGARLSLGSAVLEITGPCAPCSRMTEEFGPGGYNALRGHGGWCARVVQNGQAALGDSVTRR